MSKKKSIIIVVAVLVALAAAITVLALLNRPENLPETGSITVKWGESSVTLTMEDIQALDYVEIEKEIVSASFQNDQGVFRGVPLHTLLESQGIDLDSSAQAVVRSEDGYVAAYPMDEVTDSDNIILAYAKDGEGLGTKDSGGSGPFRIIIADDEFGNRSAKHVSEIEAK